MELLTHVFMAEIFRTFAYQREASDGIIFHRWYGECASRWVEFYERVVRTKKYAS